MNPVQFNILAIILILGLLPIATALVSNAGTSSDTRFQSTMPTTPGVIGEYLTNTYWIDNGGDNYTQWYLDQGVWIEQNLDCAYVKDGFCTGHNSTTPPRRSYELAYLGFQFWLPTVSTEMQQSHWDVSPYPSSNLYAGASGSDIFSWHYEPKFFEEIEQGSSIDGLKFWMVDEDTLSCNNYNGFANITFTGSIDFHFNNQTRSFTGFDFSKSNKFEYSDFDYTHGGFSTSCAIGFTLNFDFSNFETLSIDQFNGGDWDNTSVSLYLENFERKDGANFADTPLPFAGNGFYYLGIEYKEVNPVEVGFIVKTGTLILSVLVIGVGLASTPYWDPFRNFFKGGMIE